ncbi:glycosyltransferase family A protein [Thiocapsa sp.]|uniref:glycosyltransferase family 2 protein n=1 Tax=Thiocapsa sp. TaxID=2024551 RepID=UPI00262C190D|nr:glycosyltransferase family A protein [Thiocapsa sp.]
MIIPNFNVARWVGRAIRSALAQTGVPVEVIVIDDGSTDDSLAVIREFGEAILWESGPNRGACAARNRGLALSRGAYLQFLDADDELLPGKLAHQVALLASGGEAAGFVAGAFKRVDTRGMVRVVRPSSGDAWTALIEGGGALGNTCSNLWVRSALMAAGGWNLRWPASQEAELMFRLLAAGARPCVDPLPMTQVYAQPDSISNSSTHPVCSPKAWRCWTEIRIEIHEYLRRTGQWEQARRDVYQMKMISLARLYSRQDPVEAQRMLHRALGRERLAVRRPHLLYRLAFNFAGFGFAEWVRAVYGHGRGMIKPTSLPTSPLPMIRCGAGAGHRTAELVKLSPRQPQGARYSERAEAGETVWAGVERSRSGGDPRGDRPCRAGEPCRDCPAGVPGPGVDERAG